MTDELLARLKAEVEATIGLHDGLAARMPGMVPVETFHAFLDAARAQRMWINGEHDRFAERDRREAELYAVLLLEIEHQLGRLLRTPGKGTVAAETGAGSPISRLGAAIVGLRQLRAHLDLTDERRG